jgi:threonine/homoserine/homoserine lactone efflux protein
MTAALVAFTVTAGLLVVLPGPDTLVVVRNLLRGGRRGGTASAFGVMTGLVVWVAGAVAGISAMLRASRIGYDGLRIVGACYLVWVGVQAWRSRAADDPDTSTRRPLLGSGYVAGLATDLLNPKVGVMFVSMLPSFVPRGADVATTSLVFGAIFIVETAIYFTVLVLLAGRVVAWMTDDRTRRRLERAAGVVFIGFGVRLAAGE